MEVPFCLSMTGRGKEKIRCRYMTDRCRVDNVCVNRDREDCCNLRKMYKVNRTIIHQGRYLIRLQHGNRISALCVCTEDKTERGHLCAARSWEKRKKEKREL